MIDRYPGTQPFSEHQESLFFGRTEEVEDLFHAIKVNNLFVIHSESGIGKSSLINAGLKPKLRKGNFFPVRVEFKNHDVSPVESLLQEVRRHVREQEHVVQEGELVLYGLWHCVKLLNIHGHFPVLIFDQFEDFEFFSEKQREELIAELVNLLSLSPPVFDDAQASPATNMFAPESRAIQPDVKVVLSLKSSKLGLLEEFSFHFPLILKNRYQIKPLLLSTQARQAMVQPALLPSDGIGEGFSTRPFKYDSKLVDAVLKTVGTKANAYADTMKLQMLCQHFEELAKEQQAKQMARTDFVALGDGMAAEFDEIPWVEVSLQDVGGIRGLGRIVEQYYSEQLAKIKLDPKIDRTAFESIKLFIERKLIVDNSRQPLAEKAVNKFFTGRGHTGKERDIILDVVKSLKLVRDVKYGEVVFYEIGHETLVPSILKESAITHAQEQEVRAAKKRKEEEDRWKEQERIARQHEQIAKENERIAKENERLALVREALVSHESKRLRRNAMVALIFFVFIVMFLISGLLWYMNMNRKLEQAEAESKRNYRSKLIADATTEYEAGHHPEAFQLLKAVDSLGRTDTLRFLRSRRAFSYAGAKNIVASSDKKYLCALYPDNMAHVWNHTGTLQASFCLRDVYHVGFVPNTHYLYYTVADSTGKSKLIFRDCDDAGALKGKDFILNEWTITAANLSFSPSGCHLIFRDNKNRLYPCLLGPGGLVAMKALDSALKLLDTKRIQYLKFAESSEHLVVIVNKPFNAALQQIYIYDMHSLQPKILNVVKNKSRLKGHWIVYRDQRNRHRLYDLHTGTDKALRGIAYGDEPLAILSDSLIAVRRPGQIARLYVLNHVEQRYALYPQSTLLPLDSFKSVTRTRAITLGADSVFSVFDLRTGNRILHTARPGARVIAAADMSMIAFCRLVGEDLKISKVTFRGTRPRVSNWIVHTTTITVIGSELYCISRAPQKQLVNVGTSEVLADLYNLYPYNGAEVSGATAKLSLLHADVPVPGFFDIGLEDTKYLFSLQAEKNQFKALEKEFKCVSADIRYDGKQKK